MTEENKGTILIADDDPYVLFMNQRKIDEHFPGFFVQTFEDGISLERRLNEDVGDVRLVITDNQMPGPDGSDIIRNYARKLEQIPFVLFYGGKESLGKSLIQEHNNVSYDLKSPNWDGFVSTIRRALDYSEWINKLKA